MVRENPGSAEAGSIVSRAVKVGEEKILATAGELYKSKGKEGVVEFANKWFDSLNVRPEYRSAGDPGFREGRERLSTEPGLIVSNHPNRFFDEMGVIGLAAEVMDNFDRFKIVVRPGLAQRLEPHFGPDFFIEVPGIDSESKEAFAELVHSCTGHMADGGLLALFPSGIQEALVEVDGRQELDRGRQLFEGLLAHVVNGMKKSPDLGADTMIYSTHLDSQRILAGIMPELGLRAPGAASSLYTDGALSVNRLLEELSFGIDEKCQSVQDWLDGKEKIRSGMGADERSAAQEAAQKAAGVEKGGLNRYLWTSYYYQQFGIDYKL